LLTVAGRRPTATGIRPGARSCEAAAGWGSELRAGELLARYSGEEFVARVRRRQNGMSASGSPPVSSGAQSGRAIPGPRRPTV
jgi:hypothetical protein